MEQREVEIDLIDFMYDVFSHWRGLIACILIGALLGGGYSYMQSASAAQVVSSPMTLETYEAQLSVQEQADVKSMLLYDQLAERYASEPFLELDASNVAEGTLILSVNSEQNEQQLAGALRQLLSSTEYYSYIAEQEAYTGDVRKMFLNADAGTAVDATKVVQTLTEVLDGVVTGNTVAITCVGESEELCSNVLKDTQEYLQEKTAELTRLYGTYTVSVLTDSVSVVADSRVSVMQSDTAAKYATAKAARDALDKTLTDAQREYYQLLKTGEEATAATPTEPVVVKPQVSKKMILLGAFGLFVLYGMYLFFAYAFNGRWQNHSSYKESYGLTDLGMIRKTDASKKRGLDAWIARARLRGWKELSVEEAVDTLSSTIALQTEKEEIRTLAFVGGNYGADTEAQMHALAEALQKKNTDISVKILYDVSYNATAIDQLAGVDAVVLVETATKSRISEMTKEILLLTNQKIRILGGITI